jgi:hypothetical protein
MTTYSSHYSIILKKTVRNATISDNPFSIQTSPFGLVNAKSVGVDNCNAETRTKHYRIQRNSALYLIGRDVGEDEHSPI